LALQPEAGAASRRQLQLASAAAWIARASRDGVQRASARRIAPRDLRIAWTSLPTELARAFGKRTSVADVTGAKWYYAAWRRIVLRRAASYPPGTPLLPPVTATTGVETPIVGDSGGA